MLRRAANDEPIPTRELEETELVPWVVLSGLGPLACHLLRLSGYEEERIPAALRGAELAGRLHARDLNAALEVTVDLIENAGLNPVAMKGVTFAQRYYPRPHLRVMKDVDILVASDEREAAEAALLAGGFVRGQGMTYEQYLPHHHAAPLHHPKMQIWIEIHSGLIPVAAKASTESPFNYTSLADVSSAGSLAAGFSMRLKPEVELLLLATAWCRDLGDDFGEPGLQRRLFDAVYLLRAESDLDWDQIVEWSRHTLAGKCCGMLLSYLERHVDLPGPARDALSRIENRFQGRRTTQLTHFLLDRYLLADQNRARWLSRASLANVFASLLGASRPWRSVARLPAGVLWPRENGKRQSPAFHWHRLRSYLSRVFAGLRQR